ncbi:DUF4198 domain-containing protein [Actimicrobium sp. CCC2.4]|uniref:DUF4198 domain-containing protein n=1 Tax=Actimicrobium sp. CCC2.4 TaxID=3048606 RepID=UPI002AC8F1B0|nr:DUF4198 domain-containing protein [Actimicrobium sp. CCC2.4]MEB0136354.1 DUF4198 domain-containing protein [Actimicrobium sp. CCC2.4]WPX31174.1 DUF4198 domain-containing protein [Actimicrobium sp. CCC2.4]
MRHWITTVFATLLMMVSGWAGAHEFWLRAEPLSPRVGTSAQLFIYFGEYFEGTQAGFLTSHSAALRHYSVGGSEDLMGLVPSVDAIGQVPVRIGRAGTHLVAFDSHTAQITLPADKFNAYLHDEGLDSIVREREAAGTLGREGRERFRRHTKTLMRAGGTSDATYAMRTGQRLELVPLDDPLSPPPGAPLRFKLLFDGKPLPDALLRAWHHNRQQTVSIRAISDSNGDVTYTFPYAGTWMISTVHMIAATDAPGVDWDSFWGSLMFEVPARK